MEKRKVLEVEDVYLTFGGVTALSGVSFDVREGEILSIIGPNGAGKTSMLNCINGFYKPDSGQITFMGKELVRSYRHLSRWQQACIYLLSFLLCGGPFGIILTFWLLRIYNRPSTQLPGPEWAKDRADPAWPRDQLVGAARQWTYVAVFFTSSFIGVFYLYHLLRYLEGTVDPHKIARLGISRTFQNIQLYTGLNTVDNLMAARHLHFTSNFLENAIYFGRAHHEEIKHRQAVEETIEFLEIQPYRKTVVGALPYGLRKRIDLGRALTQKPKLLLLDEPMAGMNVEEKEDMARFILDVQEDTGMAIVLIEHDMGVVMDITDRIVVLDFGRKIAEGVPDEVKNDPAVIKAYLGD